MNAEEAIAASDALIEWFDSQRISPFDAIAVMAVTLAHIHEMAQEPTEEVG